MRIRLVMLILLICAFWTILHFVVWDLGSITDDLLLLKSSKVIALKLSAANELQQISGLSNTGYLGLSSYLQQWQVLELFWGHPVVASDGRWCSTSFRGGCCRIVGEGVWKNIQEGWMVGVSGISSAAGFLVVMGFDLDRRVVLYMCMQQWLHWFELLIIDIPYCLVAIIVVMISHAVRRYAEDGLWQDRWLIAYT